jgi:penicillin amidase
MRTYRLMMLWCAACLGAMVAIVGCGDDDDDDNDNDDNNNDTADDDDDTTVSPVLEFPVDEEIALPGLEGEARVALDEFAIPYIFAGSKHDLALVLGYMEARQRFFQLDFLRHTFEGRLTEYLWKLPLESDIYYRSIFLTRNGNLVFDEIAETLDDDTRAQLQAFADGINAWLDEKRNADPLTDWPKEYEFFFVAPADVPDWEVRDTIALARYQTWDLSSTLDYELDLTYYHDALETDQELYEKVFTRAMATDTTVLPPTKSAGAKAAPAYRPLLPPGYQGLERTRAFIQRAKAVAGLTHRGKASNNWIISPSINNGVGYLANDPHLNLTYPAIFLLGYLDDKELGGGAIRNWGSIFPGTPAVVIGANENLAWGETVAGYDVTDVYLEQVTLQGGKPKSVLFNGDQVPLIKTTQKFKIRWAAAENVDLYVVPHHGPILPDSLDGNTALSFRWTGHEPTGELLTFLDLREAADVSDGFAAVEHFKVGAQNFVLQDTAGNIGYYPYANVPQRNWDLSDRRPWHVLIGNGSAEWGDYLNPDDLPQALNPERGFLLTANNDINGSAQGDDPTAGDFYWYFSTDIGYRAQRIDEMLSALAAGKGFTMADMEATQLDVQCNWARDLLAMVQDALDEDLSGLTADARAMLDYLSDWNYELRSGVAGIDPAGEPASDPAERYAAVASMAFAQFEHRLREATFGDDLNQVGVGFPNGWDETLVALKNLPAEDDLWDDVTTYTIEDRRDMVVKALNRAAVDLASRPEFAGADVDQWFWGRVHNLQLGHLAFSALGFHFGDLGPYAIPGGMHTVNVADYAHDGVDYLVDNGPALRIIHEFADGKIVTHIQYPGGQIPVFGDPHQKDMLMRYLNGNYYEMPHDVDSILDHAESMIAFQTP